MKKNSLCCILVTLAALTSGALTVEKFHRSGATAGDVTRGDKFAFEVEPEDMPAGLNHIVFMNASPNLGDNKAYYFGFDAIILEPIRPTDGTIFFLR